MHPRILLLEDDPKLSAQVKQFLQREGFRCDVVYDGAVLFRQLTQASYQVYLLDINVPQVNGLEVCRRIRETDPTTPVLMLTAYGDVSCKVEALGMGADDYLVKPFHYEELLARIRALLRRGQKPQQIHQQIVVSDLEIDLSESRVKRAGTEITLTPKEYKLLVLLAEAKGRTVSKQTIAEQVWDIDFETGTNTIEVYISFLRSKIDKQHEEKLIHTRPGFGYSLKEA